MKRIVSFLLATVICLSQVITLAADNETTLKNVTLYNWDFSDESQTADNVLTLTNAEYVSDNQNIRLNAKTGAASVSVNLETSLTANTADNIINIEFDMNFGKISGQSFSYSIASGVGNIIECSFSPNNLSTTGSMKIGAVAATSEGAAFNECVTAYNGDGMSASATHFRNEINLAEGTATVYITGSSRTGIFTGSFDKETYITISGLNVSMTQKDTSRFSYIDNIKFSQFRAIERPLLDELVQYVTADAEGDTTTVDTSKMVYGEHIEKFLVTTAKDGVLIKQYETEAADSVTVDTTGAENIEISPIYSYTELTDIAFNTAEGVTLDNINALGEIADGRYDFTIKRANGTNVTDIYINDGMVVNNSEQSGVGRSTPKGFEYIINDVRITGGSVNVKTLRTEQGSKSAGYANAVTYPSAPISYITIYGTDDIHKAKTFYRWGLGLSDYIHLSYTGAMKWASFVAQDLYNQGFITSLNTNNVFTQTDEEGNKIICSVSETPKTIKSHICFYSSAESQSQLIQIGGEDKMTSGLPAGIQVSNKKADGIQNGYSTYTTVLDPDANTITLTVTNSSGETTYQGKFPQSTSYDVAAINYSTTHKSSSQSCYVDDISVTKTTAPSCTITFDVKDSLNNTISNPAIMVTDKTYNTVIAPEQDGTYKLCEGLYEYTVTADGYGTVKKELELSPATPTKTISVRLTAGDTP